MATEMIRMYEDQNDFRKSLVQICGQDPFISSRRKLYQIDSDGEVGSYDYFKHKFPQDHFNYFSYDEFWR